MVVLVSTMSDLNNSGVRSSVVSHLSSNISNRQMNSLPPRQEIFGKEISKVQELMLENEQSYEAQIKELTNKLNMVEEENDAIDRRIAELESKDLDQYEKTIETLERDNKDLLEDQKSLTIKNKEILMVVEEYQRSNSKFQSQYDTEDQQLCEQKKALVNERDIALQHVENMEADFNSVHQKYEKCKSVIEQFKENERKLSELSQESDEKLRLTSLCYQNLKDHATDKLEKSHAELSTIVRNNKTELAKLQAIQRKMDLKCESQEESILQNRNELKETVKMCDGLIGKFHE